MKLARKNPTDAFNLFEVLVVITVVAILAALLMTVTTSSRPIGARRVACITHLEQVALSFRLWANDHDDKFPAQVSTTNNGAMEFVAGGDLVPLFRAISNELITPKILVCPVDTHRSAAADFTADFNSNRISYFVNQDASVTEPQMFLSGDRNLTTNGIPVARGVLTLSTNEVVDWTQELHDRVGNIAFSDCHVEPLNHSSLNQALQISGVATNRLVMP